MNAIVTSISDNYTFALANLLISIKKNSHKLLLDTDVIIFSEDLSQDNLKILKQIYPRIFLKRFDWTGLEKIRSTLTRDSRYGIYVFEKVFAFELLEKYANVIHLDADILIKDDISELQNISDIAWRPPFVWKASHILQRFVKVKNQKLSAPSGGVIVFGENLRQAKITRKDILYAYEQTETCERGGVEEKVLTYLVFSKNIKFLELGVEYNCPVTHRSLNSAKVIHFYGARNPKPWLDLDAFNAVPEWNVYHREFMSIARDLFHSYVDPVCFSFDYVRAFRIRTWMSQFSCLLTNLVNINSRNLAYSVNLNDNYIQFYIDGLPRYIHYEIRSQLNDSIYVGLHCERLDKHNANDLRNFFKILYECLNTPLFQWEFSDKPHIISIEISILDNQVEYAFNCLIERTLDQIRRFLI